MSVHSRKVLWAIALSEAENRWAPPEEKRQRRSDRRLLKRMEKFLRASLDDSECDNPIPDILKEFRIQGPREGLVEGMVEFFKSRCLKDNVRERAEQLEEAAKNLVATKNGKRLCNQHNSAFSKVAWFVRPNGWTMFDKFAYDGLMFDGVRGQTLSMAKFYKCLDALEFQSWCDLARNTPREPFCTIPVERVFDKALMSLARNGSYKRMHDFLGNSSNEKYLAIGAKIAENTKATKLSEHLSKNWALH